MQQRERVRRRVLLAVAVGLAAAITTAALPAPVTWQGAAVGDIGVPLLSMDKWLAGEAPYPVTITAGATIPANPFTTMLAMAPFLLVPLALVAPLFMGLSSGLLAYGLLRDDEYWRLLAFLSTPYWFAVYTVQWSPLLSAALLLPGLLVLAPVKPQLGLVLLASGRWNWRRLLATGLFVLVSLALYPAWPLDFLREGGAAFYDGRSPVLGGGVAGAGYGVLAAATVLLFWREWRARLLLALALVPQRLWYDQLLLFVVPQSLRAMLLLVACSWGVVLLAAAFGWLTLTNFPDQAWALVVLGLYLPALGMFLAARRQQVRARIDALVRRFSSRPAEPAESD
jgi:hypothetical protein